MINPTVGQLTQAAATGRPIMEAYVDWGGDEEVPPEQARAEIVGLLDVLPERSQAHFRWALFANVTADQARDLLWWVVPEGMRWHEHDETPERFEGEVVRARRPWDPPDILDQLEAVGWITPDVAKQGRIQSLPEPAG